MDGKRLTEHNENRRIREELFEENKPIESWRIFKIMAEFVSGFELLQQYELAVTFFGTARCSFGDRVYQMASELGGILAREGFTVITGGGGGVMEAGNRGAYEAGGASVGLNIHLPREQVLNSYTTNSESFHYFFTRKVMLSFASEVYVFFPGGFGTLDEFFEIITLVQTKKIKPVPIVLIDREYWEPLLKWVRESLYNRYRAINEEDMKIYHLVDSIGGAHKYIVDAVKK